LNFAPELHRLFTPQPHQRLWTTPPQNHTQAWDVSKEKAGGQSSIDHHTLLSLMSDRRTVRQGESIYLEHDRFEFVYAVHSGSFKSTVTSADGGELVSNFHMTGDLLGLDGVAENHHASGATALEDSEVFVMSYNHLHKLTDTTAGLQHTVIRLISREIVRGNCHLVLLNSLNSAQRVAAFLLGQSENLRERGYSPVEFNLKMTRSDIGSFLGLTLETVSRMFSELQQQRLLKVDRRRIVISDLDALGCV